MVNSDQSFRSLSTTYFVLDQLINYIKDENLTNVMSFIGRKLVNWNELLPEYGAAPMHFLAGKENEVFAVAVLKRALRDGGDPNVRMEGGVTPLHLAAMWGRCRVLETLLTSGADPELVDWMLGLNAEQYALKEHQYQAYDVLSTYSVIVDDVDRFSKYICNENSPDSSPRDEISTDSNKDKMIEDNNKTLIKDDWNGGTMEHLSVDGKALEIIKEHRSGTRLCEHPKTTSYKEYWEKVMSELPKRMSKELIYGNCDELNDGHFPEKHNEHEISFDSIGDREVDKKLQPIYEEIKGNIDDSDYSIPKKDKKHRSSLREESELYLHGFEEVESYQTEGRRRSRSSRPSGGATTRSRGSNHSEVDNQVLCKMSRIYLFMLKKRQIFQRAKKLEQT